MTSSPKSTVKAGPWKYGLIGFDLPLDHSKSNSNQHIPTKILPTPLRTDVLEDGYCSLPLLTLRELAMLQIMNAITDKPDWETKVFDDTIADKWKAEAIATEGADVTTSMMDYVIAELRWKAHFLKQTGALIVYNGDVVKSDTAIPQDLKEALKNGVQALENVPAKLKDYHPGSDNQVLDLVHPSLFPLIYGRSRILTNRTIGLDDAIDNIGKDVKIKDQDAFEPDLSGVSSWRRHTTQSPYSKNYQWLPCQVAVEDGKARIVSYINNLHPHKHRNLYDTISEIITKTIPLWNITLDGLENRHNSTRIKFELEFDPDPEDIKDEDKPPQRDDEDEDEYWERIDEWERSIRRAVPPEPEPFVAPSDDVSTSTDLFNCKDGLQIIVKLANIELTPEKPEYAGGTWHVEGQLNEHICASALYYYDNTNITDSHLSFRQHVHSDEVDELHYPQGIHEWLTEIYGVTNYGPTVQEVGSVLTCEDRLLTFPNILQHQVQSFKLSDPTKPGHRKILALFLVDPSIKIIGTEHVPPQRRDWWVERMYTETFTAPGTRLRPLSNELKDKILEGVDEFPIGLEEAKEIRLKLMEERREFKVQEASQFEQHTFSLCEH